MEFISKACRLITQAGRDYGPVSRPVPVIGSSAEPAPAKERRVRT